MTHDRILIIERKEQALDEIGDVHERDRIVAPESNPRADTGGG